MNALSSLSSLARAFRVSTRPQVSLISLNTASPIQIPQLQQTCNFSTTAALAKGRKRGRRDKEPRITAIRWSLYHPLLHLPRPLRFSRMRALRHWTIHRAWLLYQRQLRQAQNVELERQWESMRAATEELRIGVGDGGKLYRKAISKKGIWGGRSDIADGGRRQGMESGDSGRVEKGREGGVPIEYSRALVDAPSKSGWDHEWTRS